ncbi:MAG: ATP-grasp domain-containing protein [Victivallales bacterium]|nr:ATP-grasp domain-containing protein [Victivallales bacterium]
MDFSKIRVLLTDGSARQTLTILHGLKEIGCHVTVLCPSKYAVCYASNLPDEKILNINAAGSLDGFEDFLHSQIISGKYDVLLPVAEMTTNKVTQHEDEYKKYVKLACAPRKAYIQAFNKQNTFEHAMNIGMPCPVTRRSEQSVEDYLNQVEFPVIIKPRSGMGSIGFHKFEKREDFWPYVQEHQIDLNQYVLQKFIQYDKYLGAILFVDQKGNVCMSYADEVLRWFPIDAGTACLIRSIDNPELLDNAARLLKAMNWQGVAALSFMIDKTDNTPKLQEINGRIPASIKLSWQCGFNVAKLLIEMAYDQDVEQYPANIKFGQLTRHFHADFWWFIKSPNRFHANPSWFSWKDTKDVVYWDGDIKPWFAYTIQKILGFQDGLNKRRH